MVVKGALVVTKLIDDIRCSWEVFLAHSFDFEFLNHLCGRVLTSVPLFCLCQLNFLLLVLFSLLYYLVFTQMRSQLFRIKAARILLKYFANFLHIRFHLNLLIIVNEFVCFVYYTFLTHVFNLNWRWRLYRFLCPSKLAGCWGMGILIEWLYF